MKKIELIELFAKRIRMDELEIEAHIANIYKSLLTELCKLKVTSPLQFATPRDVPVYVEELSKRYFCNIYDGLISNPHTMFGVPHIESLSGEDIGFKGVSKNAYQFNVKFYNGKNLGAIMYYPAISITGGSVVYFYDMPKDVKELRIYEVLDFRDIDYFTDVFFPMEMEEKMYEIIAKLSGSVPQEKQIINDNPNTP